MPLGGISADKSDLRGNTRALEERTTPSGRKELRNGR
jgi:hypothetical protein